MPDVANCPQCERLVSLPAGAHPAARVRCPLCGAEYLLQDAINQGPPLLVLLDQPETAPATIEPAGDSTFEDWSSLGPEAGQRDRAEIPPPAVDVPAEGWSTAVASIGKGVYAVEVPAVEARLSANRKSRRWPIRSLVGVVGGGVLGLALGYVILQWLPQGGREKDFLNITPMWPRFLVPPSYRRDEVRVHSDRSDASRRAPAREADAPLPAEPVGSRTNRALVGKGTPPPEPAEPNAGLAVPSSVRSHVPGLAAHAPDDLPKALQAAHDVRDALTEGRLADATDEKKKQNAYQAFCRLAEVVTSSPDGSGAGEIREQNNEIEELLRYVANHERIQSEVNVLASRHLARGDRSNHGVFLVGRVEAVRRLGTRYVVDILPTGQDRVVRLISDTLPLCEQGEVIAVLGSAMDDPENTLVSGQGLDKPAIWLGMTVQTEPD